MTISHRLDVKRIRPLINRRYHLMVFLLTVSDSFPETTQRQRYVLHRRLKELNAGHRGVIYGGIYKAISIYLQELRSDTDLNPRLFNFITEPSSGSGSTSSLALASKLEVTAIAAGQPKLGMQIAEALPLMDLFPLARTMRQSATFEGALKILAACFQLLQTDGTLHLHRFGSNVQLTYIFHNGLVAYRRQLVELMVGLICQLLYRVSADNKWSPAEVHFEHLRNPEGRPFFDDLAHKVTFGSKHNAIIFGEEWLRTPLFGPITSPGSVIVGDRDSALFSRPARFFVTNIASEIRHLLASGAGNMDQISSHLGYSRASLFRHLAQRGLQYSELVQLIRMATAEYYLSLSNISVVRISQLLGYSEHSAFTRSFTKFFYMSPVSFRQIALAELSGPRRTTIHLS